MTGVITGEAVVLDQRVARLATRFLARLIDMLIQLAALILIRVLVTWLARTVDPAALRAIAVVLLVGVVIGYPVMWETWARGRTPGKMALGLRAVSADGGPIRFRQALFRALAGVIEIWILSCVPAVVSSLISENGKRLGDVFAGTMVLQERVPRGAAAAPAMPPALADWAAGLQLSQLPDHVAMLARDYLGRLGDFDPAAREAMGNQLAETVARYVSPQPPTGISAPDYLAAVLAERRARASARMADAAPAAEPSRPPATDAPQSNEAAGSEQPTRPRGDAGTQDAGGFVPPV